MMNDSAVPAVEVLNYEMDFFAGMFNVDNFTYRVFLLDLENSCK